MPRTEAARIVEQARETARELTETARAAGEAAGASVVAEQGAALERTIAARVAVGPRQRLSAMAAARHRGGAAAAR